jgi:hypothetical protein
MISERDIPDGAILAAEGLAGALTASGTLDPVFLWLDQVITSYDKVGRDVEDFLPSLAEPGLGFSRRNSRNGKSLWKALRSSVHQSICENDGEFRKQLDVKNLAAGGLIAQALDAIGWPKDAIPLAIAVAAVISAIGIQAFCDWGKTDE